MRRRTPGWARSCVAAATVAAGVLVSLAPAGATDSPLADKPNFLGTARIPACSASIVRFADSTPAEKALLLTNGHCYQPFDKRERFRGVVLNQPDNRRVTLLKRNGQNRAIVHTKRALYSSSFTVNLGLYRLGLTYRGLRERFHVPALTISDTPPVVGDEVLLPSGYWREQFTCHVEASVFKLFNQTYLWRHSLRYASESTCKSVDGSSGSPLLDPDTRMVLGIHNAGNNPPEHPRARGTGGFDCSFSLCEMTKGREYAQFPHRRYGQGVWWLTQCVDAHHNIDLALTGCRLPEPPG